MKLSSKSIQELKRRFETFQKNGSLKYVNRSEENNYSFNKENRTTTPSKTYNNKNRSRSN